ncbi:PIR protein [Plasmodium yoelii]|uniref:PIR protein n=3 Tax=Plasmodium yoelii TaxID=5861 RepID=A0AAF0B2Q0_PLAYO|nr:PIR protein [Plasmodium yoelii]EAA15773.1 putative yir1 protein [Plasmodium yoelii yoelii]WBY55199.1 PIR protein [Plasmodium yoelii yoelii]CDU16386.1 YIR protein [Plasmodium yoelii]VTZ73123.1 PIR protein [Plasmodium yoelii]|eukprot:XP_022811509.1 PIR protein [Plasmodium yoelii]
MGVNLCDALELCDNGLVFDQKSQNYTFGGSYTNMYCPDNKCDNDDNKKISSAFIGLLGFCKDYDDIKNLESDKNAEYAILWLGHKLNQKTDDGTTTLKDFYNNHIETNSHYNQKTFGDSANNNIKIDVIDAKIKSMNMNIKDISNFYDAFKLLCKMNKEIGTKKIQCNTCLKNAGEFYEKCEKVKNIFDINKGSSYLQLLSSLLKDYDKFKEKYKKDVCNDIEFLVTCPRSSVTKSQATKSPVIECPVIECPVIDCPVTNCPMTKNTLITIAIIFVAASILLGISYKYSLFGFRKRFQKQHLKEKLKKQRRN